MSGAIDASSFDDGGGVNVGAGTSSSSSPSHPGPVLAPHSAAKRRKRDSREDNGGDEDDAESVVEVENDDEDEEGNDGRTDNFSEVHVETFRAHYDIKIRNFCQAINEKVITVFKGYFKNVTNVVNLPRATCDLIF